MLALMVSALLPLVGATQSPRAAPPPRPAAPAANAPSPLLPAHALSQLFVIPDRWKALPGQEATRRRPAVPRQKVICGMTVVIVDGASDPKFAIPPAPGRGEPMIRRVPKPMCGEQK